MANDSLPQTSPLVTSRILRDYLYSRLRSGANLSLSDKLLGLVMLSRDSARSFEPDAAGHNDSPLPPQVIGHLKGYLLNSRGSAPGDTALPDVSPDFLNDALRGRITKFNA